MLASTEAESWYRLWDMAQLAAYVHPFADPDDLDLGVDKMAFFFILDDQFDGPLGLRPADVAVVVNELIEVLYRPVGQPPPRAASPLATFFADLWDRSRQGMSPSWTGRTAAHWEYYLAAHTAEAMDRVSGEIPAVAFHSPELRAMHEIGVDVAMLCNDVYSVYKEAPRGDVDNAVLVIERDRGCSRAEAMRAVHDLVMDEHVPAFQRAEQRLSRLCTTLGLDQTQSSTVHRFAESIKAWMRGYHQWEVETTRYTPVGTLPADQPNYVEYLAAPLE
ncbi:terpene synthase family protein [Kitasatospora sp. NPDC094011]|uniref:terpene synthase family protein n=1 Tax=Kitasatospora sp. NPDC094011 TaxID=3364090 RepID=UPI0037F88979